MSEQVNDQMKHLLLVCYFYPPDGGAGTQRPLSIARHAADNGYRVTVLTRDNAHERSVWDPADASLHASFDHVREVRVKVPEGSNAHEMTAGEGGHDDPWLTSLTQQAIQLNASDPFDHILITMPPYGMAPLAQMMKQAFEQTPVSIDLRDPWAFDGAFAYASRSKWRQNLAAMHRTLRQADGVIVNTPEVVSRVLETFDDLDPNRIEVVTNGFEPDLFETDQPPQPEGYDPNLMHLVHVGTLHSSVVMRYRGLMGRLRQWKHYRAEPVDILGRTATPIMKAIGQLNRKGYPGIDKLRLVLVGLDDNATRQLAQESGCSDQVVMTGYMPHDDAVSWLRWADCLFLPLHGLPDGHRSLIVPGKTYEYLASQRPILGAVPQGDVRQFVEETGRAFIASPCDADQIAQRLSEVIDLYQQGDLPKGQPPQWAARFSRPALTQRLCCFLDRIGESKASRPAAG